MQDEGGAPSQSAPASPHVFRDTPPQSVPTSQPAPQQRSAPAAPKQDQPFDPYAEARKRREGEQRRAQTDQAYADKYGDPKKETQFDSLLKIADSLRGTIGGVMGTMVGAALDAVVAFRKAQVEVDKEQHQQTLISELPLPQEAEGPAEKPIYRPQMSPPPSAREPPDRAQPTPPHTQPTGQREALVPYVQEVTAAVRLVESAVKGLAKPAPPVKETKAAPGATVPTKADMPARRAATAEVPVAVDAVEPPTTAPTTEPSKFPEQEPILADALSGLKNLGLGSGKRTDTEADKLIEGLTKSGEKFATVQEAIEAAMRLKQGLPVAAPKAPSAEVPIPKVEPQEPVTEAPTQYKPPPRAEVPHPGTLFGRERTATPPSVEGIFGRERKPAEVPTTAGSAMGGYRRPAYVAAPDKPEHDAGNAMGGRDRPAYTEPIDAADALYEQHQKDTDDALRRAPDKAMSERAAIPVAPRVQDVPKALPAPPSGGPPGGGAGGLMAGATAAVPYVAAAVAAAKALQAVRDGAVSAVAGVGSFAAAMADPDANPAKMVGNIGEGTKAVADKLLYINPILGILGSVAGEATTQLGKMMDALSATATRYGEYNPNIGVAQAVAEINHTMGDMRRAQTVGPELARYVQAQGDLQQKFEDIKIKVLMKILPLVTNIVAILEKVMPDGEGIAATIQALALPLTALSAAANTLVGIQSDATRPEVLDPSSLIINLNTGIDGPGLQLP